jgi:hypothetical protein
VNIFIKAFMIWIVIAFVEMVHGILRARFLAPKVGDFRSRQIAVFSGSILIFLISLASFSWLSPQSPRESLYIGGLWLVCMLMFELTVGHFIFRFSWKWLLNDFNFFKGRLLAFGMLFLFLAPHLVGKIQGRW